MSSKAVNITSAWIKRWLIKRINRKETLDKLSTLGPDYIHNQLYFKIEDNIVSIKRSK